MILGRHNQEERLRGILREVSYKPSWKFYVERHEFDNLVLWSEWPVPDTDRPEVQIILRHAFSISAWSMESMTDNQIVDYIITQSIRQAEMHEMDEWFRYKGDHVRDPHPEMKEKKTA
jgi:hypothetical protein